MPVKIKAISAAEIRQKFLKFFEDKQHKIVPSAPIVMKDDPTLMFTNAGMNQFKDIFLGQRKPDHQRAADTQKCLRVSGKHNDLEEVGKDVYHHTMFEMLGNWSFGDYFKEEAVQWAWELLTDVYQIPEDRLYITIFEGDKEDGLPKDQEAYEAWKQIVQEDKLLWFDKTDNFWEMGATGPCGPCSEIHVDVRPEKERKQKDARQLVNQDHPQVIELWNLVFIELNRLQNGSLEKLPQKHVDTGMGFERLTMVLQGKTGTYETDLFKPLIEFVEQKTGTDYGQDDKTDMAIRVVVDHIRAISFAIADGQLPYREGAGYVIRRILRRATRYAYSYLHHTKPLLHEMVPILVEQHGQVFPELKKQQDLVQKVIKEEENSFLRTLEDGLQRIEAIKKELRQDDARTIPGQKAFELYDTYGFPIDLTRLIAQENNLKVDEKGFRKAMDKQQQRARKATKVETADWHIVQKNGESAFIGYDHLETEAHILRYRKVKRKKKEQYQLVLDQTPFYPEGGGQVGDKGLLRSDGEKINVVDTQKEHDLIVHITEKLPADPEQAVIAQVDHEKRLAAAKNHSATHLLHAVLRQVLGNHVEQKGSYLDHNYLRFDFTHFEQVDQETLRKIEKAINKKIRENIPLEEQRDIPMEKAKEMGALAFFGEKYGDQVRVVAFDKDFSLELCGGTHVQATGEIGLFKFTNETGVSAGIRRVEAVTGPKAEALFYRSMDELAQIRTLVKNPNNALQGVEKIVQENKELQQQVGHLTKQQANFLKEELKGNAENHNGINAIIEEVEKVSPDLLQKLAFSLRKEVDHLFLVLATKQKGKPLLAMALSDDLIEEKGWKAGKLIKELAQAIQGGGGGRAMFAQAGGKDANGLPEALKKAKQIVQKS